MEKAPSNWTNMLLFSLTPAFAIIPVPLHGYFYGYDLYEWAERDFWLSHTIFGSPIRFLALPYIVGWILRNYDSSKKDFSNARDLMKDPIVMDPWGQYLLYRAREGKGKGKGKGKSIVNSEFLAELAHSGLQI